MQTADVPGWLRRVGFTPDGPAVPLSGGFLNLVWRVPLQAGRSIVVKHAPPHVASDPGVPLDPDRLLLEARALARLADSGPAVRPPRLRHLDALNHTLAMEDLGDLPDLTDAIDLASAEDLAAFVGRLHARTDPDLATAFDNPSVQGTRHQLQYRAARAWLHTRRHPEADAVGDVLEDLGLRLQQPGRCWVMGDLWPPSILVDDDGLRLIDWELTHYGQPGQDLGHLAAHLFLHPHGRPFWERFAEAYLESGPSLDDAAVADTRLHFAAELLMRAIGPFRFDDLHDRDHVVSTAVAHALGTDDQLGL
jgi:hypothetical protein